MGIIKNPLNWEPAPPAYGKDRVVPEEQASVLSRIVFEWLSPFLAVGFSRPLQKDDLWSLPTSRLTHSITNLIETNFYARVPPSKRPLAFKNATPNLDSNMSALSPDQGSSQENEKSSPMPDTDNLKTEKTKYPPRPLVSALHATFFWRFWIAGFMKLCADTLKTTTPLVSRVLLTWLIEAYQYHGSRGATEKPRGIGYGIGVGIGLFLMQEASSLLTNQYLMMTMTTGILTRTGLIGSVFRKSLRLSGRARLEHSVGQITTIISTDATRLDRSAQFLHDAWVAPIQIIISIALLINNMGYSALVGLGVIVFSFPVQLICVKAMFNARKTGVKITDRRIRLTTEILQGVRLIKLYNWEAFYEHKLAMLRKQEIKKLQIAAVARGGLISITAFTPILAAVLSFITYALVGHSLNPAIIFSSLQFFNIIREPLLYLPVVLASITDAVVALGRIGTFLTAEELEEPYKIDNDNDNSWAIKADGEFTWETVGKPVEGMGLEGNTAANKQPNESNKEKGGKKAKSQAILPTTTSQIKEVDKDAKVVNEEVPFSLQRLSFHVQKGSFVAIVGRVGCGKSSLLQSLIGEMRKVHGEVVFGGSVAYVPQQPWIVNATLRDNILFGQEDVEKKFNEIVRTCSLQHDIEVLPNGDQTEIGEKGINLSGGQKARVSLARAIYSDADIVLLDDPISAVDAHVGKTILEECLLKGPLSQKTRVLVTHALHVLARTDYIFVMEDGVIVEEGTYQDLTGKVGVFSRIIEEHVSSANEYENLESEGKAQSNLKEDKAVDDDEMQEKEKSNKVQLMSEEERLYGQVAITVYTRFLAYAGSVFWGVVILALFVLMQGSSVGTTLFLGFWTALTIPSFSEGDYMAVYSILGVSQAVFSFLANLVLCFVALFASLAIFRTAMTNVLRSPVSFFDTTPIGRIMSRFSKDQDTVDVMLPLQMFQLLYTLSTVFGTVALVFYAFPYLGIIFVPLGAVYYLVAIFYRRSSVETKRLDSLMRSVLYASYSETLTGLSTVRAYGEQDRFINAAEHGLDLENRAYYMTIAIQRWLAVRLDFFGNLLILGIALFAAGFRNTVNPSKIGVVLSYSLSITQVLSDMVSTYALNEQNMNSVERLLVYSELPPEGDETTANDPPPSWPEKGTIAFKNISLAYREDLPLVLKGVSFSVHAGEKIGVVGRTGAGKSSLIQALFRLVNAKDGAIEIDGVNIADIGLNALRQKLALVPQDSTMFSGTLRENLDPLQTRTDAEIISALQRVWLLPHDGSTPDPVTEAKFNLDALVTDEGANFSAGEKQLLSLCRAILRNNRIIILDEATSNVDVNTDAKVQMTIQKEFSTCTLVCIAHRLNTIVYYDRILVMQAGAVAEFDTPLHLFDKEDSIFRSLCNEAKLTRQDILRIRSGIMKED